MIQRLGGGRPFPMGRLDDDTTLNERDGVLHACVPPAWHLVMPNGGFLAALALRAVGARY